jgi:hypothetical protein
VSEEHNSGARVRGLAIAAAPAAGSTMGKKKKKGKRESESQDQAATANPASSPTTFENEVRDSMHGGAGSSFEADRKEREKKLNELRTGALTKHARRMEGIDVSVVEGVATITDKKQRRRELIMIILATEDHQQELRMQQEDFAQAEAEKIKVPVISMHAFRAINSMRHAAGLRKYTDDQMVTRLTEMKKHDAGCYMIHPDSIYLHGWNALQACCVVYIFFHQPFTIAFRAPLFALNDRGLLDEAIELPEIKDQLDKVIDVVMLVDFLLRPFRAVRVYNNSGGSILVTSLRETIGRWTYRGMFPHSSFFRDCLSMLPIDTAVYYAGHPRASMFVRLLRLLRLELLFTIKSAMDNVLDDAIGAGWLRPFVAFFNLASIFIAGAHILACYLYWFGHPIHDVSWWEDDEQALAWAQANNQTRQLKDGTVVLDVAGYCESIERGRCGWVHGQGYRPETSNGAKYIDAFYYAFVMVTTVGFGDISAHSPLERITTVFAEASGCALFGIVMGQITSVMHAQHQGQAHFEEKIRELEHYMDYRAVEVGLRERTKYFFETMYPSQRLYDEAGILCNLPQGLRTEVQLEINEASIKRLPFIPADDHVLMVKVCQCLQQRVHLEGEIVAREGIPRELCMVIRGSVWVLVPSELDADAPENEEQQIDDENHPRVLNDPMMGWDKVATVTSGKYFGESILFFEDMPRRKRYVTKELSIIGILDSTDMAALKLEFPEVEAKIAEFARTKLKKLEQRLAKSSVGLDHPTPWKLPTSQQDTLSEHKRLCKFIAAQVRWYYNMLYRCVRH